MPTWLIVFIALLVAASALITFGLCRAAAKDREEEEAEM